MSSAENIAVRPPLPTLFERHPLPWSCEPTKQQGFLDANGKNVEECESLEDLLAVMACMNYTGLLYHALAMLVPDYDALRVQGRVPDKDVVPPISLTVARHVLELADRELPLAVRRPKPQAPKIEPKKE